MPAFASHDNHGTDPDNRNQYIKKVALAPNSDLAANYGKDQLERSVITTGWGSGDIEVYDEFYGNTGWYGYTDCTDWNVLWTSCDIIRVRFNLTNMAVGGTTTNTWRSLGCHEFGHTGDLGHRNSATDTDNNSCMREEIWPLNFDQHDLNAIDSGV
ncbi:hypothetical protein KRM28CT15_45240 [Krasilnikovia sp. M28-CT-15]